MTSLINTVQAKPNSQPRIQPQSQPAPRVETLHPLTSSEALLKTEREQRNKNNLIMLSLLGLATLGGGTYYAYNNHKKNLNQKGNSPSAQEKLQTEYNILKKDTENTRQLVVKDFQAKVKKLRNDENIFDEFDVEIPFTNGKDLRQQVMTMETDTPNIIAKQNEIINQKKSIIKSKIAELSSNNEWKELRQIAKQMKKTIETSKNYDEIEITKKKLTYVNDLIINKIYPENIPDYEKVFGITQKDLLGIIKKDFKTVEEYENYFNSKKHKPINPFAELEEIFVHNGPMTLEQMFSRETQVIERCQEKIKEANHRLKFGKEHLARYEQKLKTLVANYRKTEGMVELKSKMAQLRKLAKELGLNAIR